MESVSTFFKEENDIFFKRGAAKAKKAILENLIIKSDFSDEKIAHIADVSIDFVKQIREKLPTPTPSSSPEW